jgi:hypothetical protein
MKTISIFAYDSLIVNDFLHLIDPMVRNLFNFEVYLYTAYGTSDTIGAVGISTTVINSIKMLKSRYKHVNNIAVYGLVATGNDTAPFESKQDEFSEWIMQHIEDLDLDGIALDYEFSTDWDVKKMRYTNFIKTLNNDIPDKQISVDIGSFKYSSVELSEICNTNIQVVNMGMYKSQPRAFKSELFYMYYSPVKHNNQIPAISFTEANISMDNRMKMLSLFGYNRLAIFNPITHANEYALDIASFIDGKSSSSYLIPSIISITCVIGIDMIIAFIFYIFNIQILIQLYMLSGVTILSFGGACRYMCIKNSMFDYSIKIYLTLQTILSLLWICMLYYFNYCDGNIYSNMMCKNITDILVLNSTTYQ